MRKKAIVFFVIFVLMLCILAACKKNDVNGIAIIDNQGSTRVLATNDNGETMTDEAGNLIVVVTGLDGNEETQRIAPPDYYTVDGTIQTSEFSIAVPKGWEQSTGISDVRLVNTKTKSEINLVTLKDKTLEDRLDSAEQVMDIMRNDGGTVETAQVTICGADATKYTVTKADSGIVTFYIFEKNGNVYSFYSAVTNEYKDSADFETIINSVQFK